jgi:hypothetical protein
MPRFTAVGRMTLRMMDWPNTVDGPES